jgi:hypothetical protein
MLPEDMLMVAELLCRVLVGGAEPEVVQADVVDFRRRFQELCFIIEGDGNVGGDVWQWQQGSSVWRAEN